VRYIHDVKELPITPMYCASRIKRVSSGSTRWAAFNQDLVGGCQCSWSFDVPLGHIASWNVRTERGLMRVKDITGRESSAMIMERGAVFTDEEITQWKESAK